LFSPWTDLILSGGSIDPRAPFASPLFADLSALPDTYVLVGSEEVLQDDSKRLVEKLNDAGGCAALSVWPKMPHVLSLFAPIIAEGGKAIAELAKFLNTQR
jgi:acetyl esterase/lipase